MRAHVVCLIGALTLGGSFVANGQILYHAKITLETGTPLPRVPQIIVGKAQNFAPACIIVNVFGNGTITWYVNPYALRGDYDRNNLDQCPVTIRLDGYQKTDTVLRDNATVVLKRASGDHEGNTISMTAIKAPEDARKAYAKGVNAIEKKKWPAAQKELEKAVEIYPEYAQAWSDLGEVHREQNQPTEARDAYEHSIKADPKYIKPYVQLARLDLSEGKNEDAARVAEGAIKQNPVEYVGIYFYNAVANFNLKRLDVAEESARRAVELDVSHEAPRSEYLLGLILATKGDREGALTHLRKYLELSPQATDAPAVKQKIEMLSGTAAAAK